MKRLLIVSLLTASAGTVLADYAYSDENLANRQAVSSTHAADHVAQNTRRAIETGEMIGLHGAPLRQMAPAAYPPFATVPGLTRAHVEAQLARAIAEGNMLASNESGLTLRELAPSMYANSPVNGIRADLIAGP